MNNNENLYGFISTIDIKDLSSGEDFALLVLKIIHQDLSKYKDSLFPCKCNCMDNPLFIELYSDDTPAEVISFEYSTLIGFRSFNLVRNSYIKYKKFNIVHMVTKVNQNCQKHEDIYEV